MIDKTDPKKVFESDLHASILFSLINFSWSMTFHHVTKDITVDITTNLFKRLVLASSFFMQIGNRLFILCFFGHQWYGSNHLSGLLGFLLVHIFTMLIFNCIFSDLAFMKHCGKLRFWLEMILNAMGCAFIHN